MVKFRRLGFCVYVVHAFLLPVFLGDLVAPGVGLIIAGASMDGSWLERSEYYYE